ncbi:hypothetical protein FOG51_02182 [Hanseniaspora uvarum]|nr:hypothetical protein FOG51_02182 [Hanseniaspora uvarum]
MAGPPPPPGPPPPSLGSSKPPAAAMPIDRNALLSSIRQGASLKKTETDDRSAPKVGGGVVENGSAAKPSMSAPAVPKPSAPSGGMDLNSMLQNAFNAKKMHAAESSVSSDIRNEIKLPSAPAIPSVVPGIPPPLPNSTPSAPPIPDSAPSAPPLPNSAPSAPPLPNAIPSIPPPLPSSTPGIPPPNVNSSAPVTRNTPPANPLAGGLPFLAEIQKKRDDSHVIDETKVPKTSETVSSNVKHEDRNTGIPAAPPLPSSIPKAPELPSGMSAAPPLPSNMPTAPEIPSGMPSVPPLPTSIPKAPELPSSIPKAPEIPSGMPSVPPLPTSIPKAPELPSSIPKAPGLPTGIPTPAANPLAGGLPFLAEIQRKRDDSHVVDEKDVAAVSKKGASSLTPHEPKLSTGMGNQRVPSIPPPMQHNAPSVPSMPPPVQHNAPSVPNMPPPVQHSAPSVPSMPPPVQHNAQSIPSSIQQTTIKTAPSHIPSSATSSSKKAPPPPPAVEPATTGNYKTRLFSDGTSTTETTSLREGRPNEQLTDSTSYLNKAGMKNKLGDIEIPENSRFKWLTKDEMPLPRPFARKTKLYPSGRGSSVPLNLKIYD